jgi:hypothetical protein
MQPFYKSASFWTMIVATIGQLLVGLRYNVEAEMLATVAGTVIAYLVYRGVITAAEVKAQALIKVRQMSINAEKAQK